MHLFSVQFPFPPPRLSQLSFFPLEEKNNPVPEAKASQTLSLVPRGQSWRQTACSTHIECLSGCVCETECVCLYAWNFSLMRLCRWERGRGNRSCVPPNPPCWYSSGRLIRQRTLCTKGRFALRAFHVLQTHNSRCKIKHPLCSVPHPLRGWELNVVIAQQSLPLRLTTGGKLPDNYIPQGFIG